MNTEPVLKCLSTAFRYFDALYYTIIAMQLRQGHAHSGKYNGYRHYTIIAAQLRQGHAHSGKYNGYRHYSTSPHIPQRRPAKMSR